MQRKFTYKLGYILLAAAILEVVIWGIFAAIYFVVMDTLPGLRWAHPERWVWLLSGPVMLLLFALSIASRNRRLNRLAEPQLLGNLVSNISNVNTAVKYILWRLAAAFLITALINPQFGSKMAEAKVKGIDIMLAVDVSNSMLAEDLSPNRLVRAKRAIEQMVEKLHGDRLGIVVFAGQPYVQLPITSDYSAAKLFLSTIDTDIVPVQGTDIGAAIRLSGESFSSESPAQKVIVVITDGENHEADAVKAAQEASDQGIKVFTIGMGSAEGAPIPRYNGSVRTGFRTDKEGNVVVSKLNEDMLRQIADAGNGSYVRASNAQVGLAPLLEELNRMEKTDLGTVAFSEYEDRFQVFIALALLCILLEALVLPRKGFWARRIKIFD